MASYVSYALVSNKKKGKTLCRLVFYNITLSVSQHSQKYSLL